MLQNEDMGVHYSTYTMALCLMLGGFKGGGGVVAWACGIVQQVYSAHARGLDYIVYVTMIID